MREKERIHEKGQTAGSALYGDDERYVDPDRTKLLT